MKTGGIMNNQIPYFMNPHTPIPNNQMQPSKIELENILNKINHLEKNIRILENRITKLETNNNSNYSNDDPTDMYII